MGARLLTPDQAFGMLERGYRRGFEGMTYETYSDLLAAILPKTPVVVGGGEGQEIADVEMVGTALENGWTLDQLHTALQGGGTPDARKLLSQVFRRQRVTAVFAQRRRRSVAKTLVIARRLHRRGRVSRRVRATVRSSRGLPRFGEDDPPHPHDVSPRRKAKAWA
jgi:hypothetical protein